MKRIIQCCLFLCIVQGLGAQTVLYVKSNASGTNDGSSWANAYTFLDAALQAAPPGSQIWVASGTYKSTTAAPANTFELQSGVELYGGFAGTETVLTQRNIATNTTILSGDALGDDIPGNFNTNRTDNAIHVLHTSNGSPSARAIVDGFTVKGGFTLLGANDPAASKRGGGIFVECKATIRNCTFTDNKSDSGSSIMAPVAAASGLVVENCTFENNDALTRAAGIYFIDLDGVQVKGCTFKNNTTQRGVMYPRSSKNVVFDNCTFEGNTNNSTTGYSSGIFCFQSNYTISNCQFLNNTAGNAVCLYHDTGKNVVIKNCTFNGNTATDYGGTGAMNFQTTYTMDSCSFSNNAAPTSASCIYNADTTEFVVSNTTFEGNTASYAAAVANYGIGCNGTFLACTFDGNVATNGGGACNNGFKSDMLFKECLFKGNTAKFGGALYTQNDTTRLRIDGCTFSDNGAETNGGCVAKNANIFMSIENSVFMANSADIGGAVYAVGDSALLVSNSIFNDNLCFTQGGAVSIGNTNADFTNCLFARNLNLSAGNAGGGLSNNASEGVTCSTKMTNCTITDNVAPIGAGVAQFEDDSSNVVLVLQNCILQNLAGVNYEVEAGVPDVLSLGGNQSSDASLTALLVNTKDQNDVINEFVNPDEVNYHLLAGTAAIDGGVTAGAPAKDIEGIARVGAPDSGCYEWGTSGVFTPEAAALPLQLAPNPAVDYTIIALNNEWSGKAKIDVVSANGKVVRSINAVKPAGNWQYRVDINDLPAGLYRITLAGGGKVFAGSIIK